MPSPEFTATAIQNLIEEVHHRLRGRREGKVAGYIPELAKADPEDFGIVVATADGHIYAVGDSDKEFTIQSISKPFAYGLALKLLGREHMHAKVGVEPSGEAFNAISLDPVSGIPRNPMINAGAIATAAQIWQHDPEAAEATLLGFLSDLAGRPLHVDENVYISERDTGHRNRAISHLLRNFNVIESDPEGGLDLYFRQCAIAVSCRDLAIMAASLACQGRNPISGADPLNADHTIQMLALMGSCGMYDYAGQWLHDVGMPAKSGVGGGVLAVVPGRLGVAVYSPRLDPFGNSVRGIEVCEELSKRLGLHLYNQNPRADQHDPPELRRQPPPLPPLARRHRGRHPRGAGQPHPGGACPGGARLRCHRTAAGRTHGDRRPGQRGGGGLQPGAGAAPHLLFDPAGTGGPAPGQADHGAVLAR